MIELPRPPFDFSRKRIKIFGLGGAGCNIIDRIALDGSIDGDIVAINTDVQALTGSIAGVKVQIGQTITRGLGAGGDPEIGRTAAEEGIGEILGALVDATIVLLVVGLGGGTGSGAAPVIAEIAREHNAMLIVVATLPFHFEGRRRADQAMASLDALQEKADILLCFENDRMGEAVSPQASIQDAFALSDSNVAQSIRALAKMSSRHGPVHAGFDEVAAVVRSHSARVLFGFGQADGKNRPRAALEAALRNPLLDRGRRFKEAESVFVQIAGGADLALAEVEIVMDELHRHLPEGVRVFFGAAVDPQLTGSISVTLLSAVASDALPATDRVAPPTGHRHSDGAEYEDVAGGVEARDGHEDADVDFVEPELGLELEEESDEPGEEDPRIAATPARAETPAEGARPAAPRPLFGSLRRNLTPAAAPLDAKEAKAEQMQFEPVNRGRFEKSEPTIIDGQDLDVPTFLRRNARLKK